MSANKQLKLIFITIRFTKYSTCLQFFFIGVLQSEAFFIHQAYFSVYCLCNFAVACLHSNHIAAV